MTREELEQLTDAQLRELARTGSRREAYTALEVLEARDLAKPAVNLGPEKASPFLQVAAPRHGIHVAGPVVDDVQVCARCGDALYNLGFKQSDRIPGRFLPVPEGAHVERGAGWQAEYWGSRKPTCPVEK